jgi:PAS domain S-box-containing protein
LDTRAIGAPADTAALRPLNVTRGFLPVLFAFAAIVAAYVGLAELLLRASWINPAHAPFWPPTGVAVALLVLCGPRVWPAVAAGSLLASLITAGTYSYAVLTSIAVVLAALAGYRLLPRRLTGRVATGNPGLVARLGLVCLLVSVLATLILAVGTMLPVAGTNAAHSAVEWATWALADLAGSLLLAPGILLWAERRPSIMGLLTTSAVVVLSIAIAYVAFWPLRRVGLADYDAFFTHRALLALLISIPLAWTALRGDRRATISAAVAFVVTSFWAFSDQTASFPDQKGIVLFLTGMAICLAIPPLLLATGIAAHQRREERLSVIQQGIRRNLAKTRSSLLFAESHFQLLIRDVTDYAIFVLDTSGKVASWNEAAERIIGYSNDEIIGKQFSVFFRPDDRRAGEPTRALELAVRNGRAAIDGWWLKKDREPFFVSGAIACIRNANGELIGFSSVMRDSTERRNAEEELVEAREQLAMAQKMEAIGKLTGGIAHDFNNLLMIIGGNAQIFKRLLDPKLPRAIEAIQTAAKRGETLTRQLLTFSRRQHLSPTVVDLTAVIRSMRPMIESSLRGNIVYKEQFDQSILAAKVDVSELQLAIVNLAVNARDAMPNGGTFTLSMTMAPPEDLIGAFRGGAFAGLTFQDTGTGIPPNLLTKIFDPFFTTKEVGKGTGLGLSQVYGFAHQAGGTVKAESKVGEGTAITVYLPLSDEKELSGSESISSVSSDDMRKVLLVDDSAEVAEVTASLFESLGYRSVYRASAEAALKLLAEDSKFELVFSDIVMPGNIDGLGLAKEVRALYPQLPIILSTGYSEVAQTVPSDLPLIRKPFDTEVLKGSIKDALSSAV